MSDSMFFYFSVAKVEVDSFGMPDVKDAVWLGRKTSTDLNRRCKWKREQMNSYNHT